jgi:hypothetical protein
MPLPSDSSIRTYVSSLNSLARDMGYDAQPEGFAWVANASQVWSIMNSAITNKGEPLSLGTKSTRLFSIKYLLECLDAPEDIWDSYEPYVAIVKKALDDRYADNQKSAKEEAEWMSLADLKKVLDDLEKSVPKKIDITNGSAYRNLMKYLVLKFHLDTPIRNDLSDAKIYKNPTDEQIADESMNYIVIRTEGSKKTGQFIDNIYKTKFRKGQLVFDLDESLVNDLFQYYDILVEFSPHHWFIINNDGEQMQRNNFTKFVQSIFRPYNKNISTSMLRKIIRSDFDSLTKEDIEIEQESKELARRMGHSLGVAKKYYVKVQN